MGESIFDRYDMTIVSTDFIKADRRRDEFLRAAPELVIVDEAHTCTPNAGPRAGRHQRYELLQGLAGDPDRHLVLVTATPHAGRASRGGRCSRRSHRRWPTCPRTSLATRTAGTERPSLATSCNAPAATFAATSSRRSSRKCSTHSRSRPTASPSLQGALRRSLRLRHGDRDEALSDRQRLRWWSALALLRSIGSSPAAAVATLSNRAANVAR